MSHPVYLMTTSWVIFVKHRLDHTICLIKNLWWFLVAGEQTPATSQSNLRNATSPWASFHTPRHQAVILILPKYWVSVNHRRLPRPLLSQSFPPPYSESFLNLLHNLPCAIMMYVLGSSIRLRPRDQNWCFTHPPHSHLSVGSSVSAASLNIHDLGTLLPMSVSDWSRMDT